MTRTQEITGQLAAASAEVDRLAGQVQLLRGRELAAQLGVTTRTLFGWSEKGLHGCRLEVIRVGGGRRYTMEAVSRFMALLDQKRASLKVEKTGKRGTLARPAWQSFL